MRKTTKKDKNEVVSPTKRWKESKEKLTWAEELWLWIKNITEGTSKALLNTLATTYELIMSWTTLLSEKLWSKKPNIKNSRKTIRKHHLHQAKKSIKNVWSWLLNIGTWSFHTTKWALRTALTAVLDSWRKTIKWLREDESEEKSPKKTRKRKQK